MQIPRLPISPEGMETTRHGSFSFPLAVYHSVMSKNVLGYIPWHWHTEIQFCLVTEGSCCFFVNGKEILLLPGEGLFVNSGILHMARPLDDPQSAYICLDADPRLLCSFPGSVLGEKYVAPYLSDPAMAEKRLSSGVPWQGELLGRVALAHRLFEGQVFGYELRLSALLQEMWLLLLEHRPQGGPTPQTRLQENAVVQGILIYLGQNYDRRIALREIAQAVSFSGSECCRIFKKVTGETIFSYLRSFRLAQSMKLLRDTGLSVSRIAYDTGFCSTSYFIESFKARQGITPLQYRKQNS